MSEKIKNPEGLKLKNYLSSLEKREKSNVIRAIVEGCKIEYASLDNWRYRNCSIPLLAQDKIVEIIGKDIFREEEIIK